MEQGIEYLRRTAELETDIKKLTEVYAALTKQLDTIYRLRYRARRELKRLKGDDD